MTVKEENLRILEWIQSHGSSGTDQYFEYIFGIGDRLEFQIRIKGGALGKSEPDEMLPNLSDYKKLNIKIFESSKRIEPRSLDNLDLWNTGIIAIFPNTDDRFVGQPWAKDWGFTQSATSQFNLASDLMASPDTVCDIVRHCQKLVGLKAFW